MFSAVSYYCFCVLSCKIFFPPADTGGKKAFSQFVGVRVGAFINACVGVLEIYQAILHFKGEYFEYAVDGFGRL